ncbi:MAG: multicopper oxidase domain-containing protein, partial [Phycisphaerae bacterium]
MEGDRATDSATVAPGTPLRPHEPIRPTQIVRTRVFEFTRRNGAWQINRRFFNPDIASATPTLGTAERWILRNNGGGWWHPVHIHLESHQIRRLNGRLPGPEDRFKSDTVILDGNGEAEIFMNFRTFRGPFVFHCHNLEHEDMRMMLTFDPRVTDTRSPQ